MRILNKKRRRENKTDYRKRRIMLEGEKSRAVVRKTNRYLILQYVESKTAQDKVAINLNSKELIKYGWPKEKEGSLKSLSACYLIGLLFGKKAKALGKGKTILDSGLIKSTKGSRVYAALKGIVDSGLEIGHNPKMFPEEKRINNENTKEFFDKVKNKILKEEK